jgi:hypothetical protein
MFGGMTVSPQDMRATLLVVPELGCRIFVAFVLGDNVLE